MSGIEDSIETRCPFVHGRVSRRAKARDPVKPRRAIVRNQVTANRIGPSVAPSFGRGGHRCGEAGSVPSVEAASSPKGRILPSLVSDEPLRRALRDAASTPAEFHQPSRAQSDRRSQSGGKDQAPKLPRNSGFSSDENAPVAARASTKPHVKCPACNQVKGQASHQGLRRPCKVKLSEVTPSVCRLSAKAKRSDKVAISRDDLRVKPLPNDQRSAMEADSPATNPLRVDDHSPQSRKRTIMARYVFGDELKPGGRWKRRLLTMR